MSQIENVWGEGPSERYEALAARYRPIFAAIGSNVIARETSGERPFAEINQLKNARFGAVRLPVEEGGAGATLPEFFNLLIELAEADSNIVQSLRGHFGFLEDVVNREHGPLRQRWTRRIAEGETLGNAWTEVGNGAAQDSFSTRVSQKDDRLVVNGTKYYTTGSLYADWIDVGATGLDDEGVVLQVRRNDPGVEIIDDWDGFGQTLTASGTTIFTDVAVDPDDIVRNEDKFRYSAAYYQTFHLATLAGIARAIANETAKAVASRTRHYSNGAGPRSSQDPQVLQVVGRLRGNAYAAGSIVLQVARALERAFKAHFVDDEAAEERANAIAELETSQALTVITNLVLESSTILFDALGASAARKPVALDRHWRNARTLASHNPRIYKDRIVGDYAVNGTPPPYQWRIGLAPALANDQPAGKIAAE